MRQKDTLSYISMPAANLVFFVITAALFAAIIYNFIQLSRNYSASVAVTSDYIALEKASHTIHVGSDYLTEQARLFVQTMKREHAANYFNELYSNRSRERAIEFVAKRHPKSTAVEYQEKALELSNALLHREFYAMRLAAEGAGMDPFSFPADIHSIRLNEADRHLDPESKISRARELLFDERYSRMKNAIMDALAKSLESNLRETKKIHDERVAQVDREIRELSYLFLALGILLLLLFVAIAFFVGRPLREYLYCIKHDRKLTPVGLGEIRELGAACGNLLERGEQREKIVSGDMELDPLTGLADKKTFDSLGDMLQTAQYPLALALVNVDHFQRIKDSSGSTMGDKCLCRVAWLLEHSFRSGDYSIRMNGDEFAVIIREIPEIHVNLICKKFVAINRKLSHPDNDLPPITISVGIAFSERGFAPDLYEKAGKALEWVREHGRNDCVFYDDINKND